MLLNMDIDCEILIDLVEKRPEIYNYTLKDHHNKDHLIRIWDEIAKEVGNVTAADCKARWNNLRSSYARYLRQIKELENSPGGSRHILRRKKWYLADRMLFMSNFIARHRSSRNNVLIEEESLDYDFNNSENESNEDKDNTTPFFQTFLETGTGNESSSSFSATPEASGSRSIKRTRTSTAYDIFAEPMIELLERKSQAHSEMLPNANLKFFESIIPDVELLSPRKQREFKLKVHTLLTNLLNEQENEAGTTNSSIPARFEIKHENHIT